MFRLNGLDPSSRPSRAEIEALVCARSEARTTGNWEVADEIRATLDGWGFGVQDAADGSTDVVDIRDALHRPHPYFLMFPFGGPSEKAHEGPRRNVPAVHRKCPDKQTVHVAATKQPRSSFRSMLLFSTLPGWDGNPGIHKFFVLVRCRVFCFLIFSTERE